MYGYQLYRYIVKCTSASLVLIVMFMKMFRPCGLFSINLFVCILFVLLCTFIDVTEKAGVAGGTSKIETLEIRWPSGKVDKLTSLPIDTYIKVKEGEGVDSRRSKL
jgi:hypothetical protein